MKARESARTVGSALVLALAGAALTVLELRGQGISGDPELAWVPVASPPRLPEPPPLAPALGPREPLARSLHIYLLDGLRVDAAEATDAWQRLAPRGARLRARLRFPVFSAPGRSLLITGAPPEVSGVLNNDRPTDGRIDHLFRVASSNKIAIDAALWTSWLKLAPFDNTLPGTRGRVLSVEDWFEVDTAGHDHGASSDEYRSAAQALSGRLLAKVAGLDLATDAVLAVSDHGHVDAGGHLGMEPEVATAPALLVGAGVRPGFARDEPVPMEDIGSTLAVLLGVPPPEVSRGVPVTDALELSPEARETIRLAALDRRTALEAAWARRVSPAGVLARRAIGAVALVALVAFVLRPFDRALAAALLSPVVTALVWGFLAPPMSVNGGHAHAHWPPYLAAYVAGLAAAVVVARVIGAARASFSRALLLAWVIAVAALLARFGLDPAGLPPHPASFALVLASGDLAAAGVLVILIELCPRRSPAITGS